MYFYFDFFICKTKILITYKAVRNQKIIYGKFGDIQTMSYDFCISKVKWRIEAKQQMIWFTFFLPQVLPLLSSESLSADKCNTLNIIPGQECL